MNQGDYTFLTLLILAVMACILSGLVGLAFFMLLT